MASRLFGIETEYAVSWVDGRGAPVDRHALLAGVLALARERLVHLPDRGGAGVFVPTGRLYIDCGEHPEFGTAECAHPDEVVRCVRTGDHILATLVAAVAARRSDVADAVVLRSNVDYCPGSHAAWGSHESLMHSADPAQLPRQLMPHLVSRIVYTGAGGFNPFSADAIEFTLSPRVWHLTSAISDHSTGLRGIFHTKNEPLAAGGYHRLHIICGDTVCSDAALWLRIGATALVVALIEAGLEPGEAVQLRDPLAAMQRFAADPTCRATAETERGEPMTALAIQRHYLELARRHAGHRRMPPWAGAVCDHWTDVLERLAKGPEAVASQLDWAIKLALFRRRVEQHGFAWGSYTAGGRKAWGVPTGRAAGLRRLRDELCEIDMRFGQLGERGICSALERAGALRSRMIETAEVVRALDEPPAIGRAHLRGSMIRQLSAKSESYSCDWTGIVDRRAMRELDLSDPFATSGHWSKAPRGEVMPTERILVLHQRAMRLYRQSRYGGALRTFLRAAGVPADESDLRARASARFWAATILHNLGRLGEARAQLDELLRAPADDQLLYMALTRRAIVDVDAPAPLADIEQFFARTEERLAALGRADWQSRMLLSRARLLEARGMYDEALAVAVEALARRRAEPNGLATPTHMRTVLVLCLRANRLTEAAQYVEEWSSWQVEYQRTAEIVLACGRSELARARGEIDAAVASAEEAYRTDEARNDRAIRAVVTDALVRALLCKGDLARAREVLLPLRRLHSAEVGGDRYQARLLWGDYQLACAQRSAGLPILDLIRDLRVEPLSDAAVDLTAAGRWLRAAERSYRAALAEGRALDALLDCDLRAREVAARTRILDRTRAQIAERLAATS